MIWRDLYNTIPNHDRPYAIENATSCYRFLASTSHLSRRDCLPVTVSRPPPNHPRLFLNGARMQIQLLNVVGQSKLKISEILQTGHFFHHS